MMTAKMNDDVCVFASCTSVYVLRVYVWLHVCPYGRWCVFGYESCPCVRMLVKCMSVMAEGCTYVVSGNHTITPVSLRVDYLIEPLSKGVRFNL